MKKDITNNPICSAGGFIKSVYYIAAQDINSIMPIGEDVRVELVRHAAWQNMSGMAEATSQGEVLEGGGWQYTVEVKVAGRGAVAPRYMQRLTGGRWLLKVVDYTRRSWLIGEADCPLACAITDTATSEATGETLYTLRFVGTQRTAAKQMV